MCRRKPNWAAHRPRPSWNFPPLTAFRPSALPASNWRKTGAPSPNSAVRLLRKFLAAMPGHPRLSWAALAVYAAAVTFPHEKVQYEVNQIAIRITLPRLYQVSAAIVLALGALLSFIVLRSLGKQ